MKGQSRYIAVFKMMGTLLASIAFFMYSRSCLITIVSIAIFIYDWIYTIFIWKVYSRNRYTM
ncbi:hypothetical protein [Inediibacterium massiliense]|uniref:hypothetical protein n=1 Tax=Inediibacterium massiliense TaxID=1658111 RepID=UPI0018FE546E|nr:hypothetical protein [Inediibacterium massiliense]